MTRLDDVIADQKYILECLELLRKIQESGNCHTCDNNECNCKPELGEMIRYNCPCYKEKASNPIVIKPTVYGSCAYAMEELREEAEKILRERAKKKERKEKHQMMVRVYRPNDEEDRKKVLDYTKELNQTGKKPMGIMIYASEEDVKKWQDKAYELGWPLQLYILNVMNRYCEYLEDGGI